MQRLIQKSSAKVSITDRDLRRLVGYNMKRAFNAVQADLQRTLAPFGLRMLTYSALSMIVENPGLRSSQLAEGLSIERANVVVLVDELAARDLVRRDIIPHDRRAHALHATTIGRQLYDDARAAVQRHDSGLIADLSVEDVRRLRHALEHIEATAREEEGQ